MSEWPIVPFGRIAKKLVNGGTPPTDVSRYWSGQIPWVTGADFTSAGIGEFRRFVSDEATRETATNVIEEGQLLLVTRTGVGKLAIAPCDIAISQDITGVYVDEEQADIVFLFHRMQQGVEDLKKLNQGTSINGIIRSDLFSYPVKLPPLPQQRRIAAILSTLDEAIEQTEALIAKMQQVKAGLMHDLFTRGVTPDGRLRPTRERAPELYKESPLGWIPKEWEVFETDIKVNVIDPQPDHRTPPEVLDGYPYVGIGDVTPTGEVGFVAARKVSPAAFNKQFQSFEIHPGAFIFGKIGTIGQPTRIPHDRFFAISANVVLFTTKLMVDADYVFWIYSTAIIEAQVADATNTTSQPALGIQRIRKFLIPWPKSPEERCEMVSKLETVSETIQAEKLALDKFLQKKQGLMHDLLSGLILVPIPRAELSVMS
jgi:type I restriction enzyme S subunit